jgi:hypothetical protein
MRVHKYLGVQENHNIEHKKWEWKVKQGVYKNIKIDFKQRLQTPLKRVSISTRLQGATSHKTAIFIIFAVRTWNINLYFLIFLS